MHLIITDARGARTRSLHFSGARLALVGCMLALGFLLVAASLYHWVFVKGAREGWPVFGALVKLAMIRSTPQSDSSCHLYMRFCRHH